MEPFRLLDGISEPLIDWERSFTTDLHCRLGYANMLAPGELVLGYPNEYQEIAPALLAETGERPVDLARNGSYLVLRQLH